MTAITTIAMIAFLFIFSLSYGMAKCTRKLSEVNSLDLKNIICKCLKKDSQLMTFSFLMVTSNILPAWMESIRIYSVGNDTKLDENCIFALSPIIKFLCFCTLHNPINNLKHTNFRNRSPRSAKDTIRDFLKKM